MNHIIINLNFDGYNYWIKAMAMAKKDMNQYDIRFNEAEDVIYSKEFVTDDASPSIINVSPTFDCNLSYVCDRTKVVAVIPYNEEEWLKLREQQRADRNTQEDFEDSLLYEDPKEKTDD